MKNSGMNKFLLCFKPVTDDDEEHDTITKTDRHVSNSITVRRLRNPEKLNRHHCISSTLASRIFNESQQISQEPSVSCSASNPQQGKTDRKDMVVKSGKYGSGPGFSFGLCLLVLMSLTMTVLCGKVAAILLTSIWLYLVPRRDESYDGRRRNKKCSVNQFKLQLVI